MTKTIGCKGWLLWGSVATGLDNVEQRDMPLGLTAKMPPPAPNGSVISYSEVAKT